MAKQMTKYIFRAKRCKRCITRKSLKNSELIDATVVYRKSGKLPVTVGDSLPSLVATQTIEDRYYSRPVRFGGAS